MLEHAGLGRGCATGFDGTCSSCTGSNNSPQGNMCVCDDGYYDSGDTAMVCTGMHELLTRWIG